MNGFGATSKPAAQTKTTPTPAFLAVSASSSTLAKKMDQHLRKEGIVPPAWPTATPGDPKQKGVVESFWQTSKGYRSKVRASLIRAGFLDDPDKPKKLSEAIDFKGTCEDMCPEFEKITRIVEHDVQGAEKEMAPDGSMWPAPHKMVKALARSAAGQDAPLPMDVRSPAALRRTLDYLLHTVLGNDGDLPTVHGFLWDRTRAIRRDFVFQSSMSPTEVSDQVYCLERITRFHVIALHQMSREEVVAEDFSEQQEVEQLGKALLSLIHAYEDCQAQGIPCENEAEFRAYYVLFNSHNSAILETVQDWGWKFWGESDQIRTAVSLIEALQNIWDTRGPLKPHSATDIAQNGFSKFFSIVADRKVSYTMACFAEIHFNSVRKSALKTILASYRKQRDQTKDWTLVKLNAYLRFDDEEDIIEFGEAYGLQFEEADGEMYLSLGSDDVQDPFPPLKQRHSYTLVEQKRGDHPLPVVIDKTVYDEGEAAEEGSDEESLFVKDTTSKPGKAPVLPSPAIAVHGDTGETTSTSTFTNPPTMEKGLFQKQSSVSGQGTAQKPFGTNFFTPKPSESTASSQQKPPPAATSISSSPPGQDAPSLFAPTPQTQPTIHASPFSFLNQPFAEPASSNTKLPLSLEQYTATASPPPTESPKPLFSFARPAGTASPSAESPKAPLSLGQYPVTASPPASQTPPSPFSLGQHSVTASPPAIQTPTPPFSVGQHSIAATPPSQSLQPQLSLGGHTVNRPTQPSVEDAPASPKVAASSNQAEQSQLPPFVTGATFSSPMQNPTFSSLPQPPVHQSQSSPAQPFKSSMGVSSLIPTKLAAPNSRSLQLDNLTKWITVGDGGLIDQFIEYQVKEIVQGAVAIFLQEKAERLAKEEDGRAKEQADNFRYRSLATRYGHRWRETAQRMWVRRRGREARKARQEMAASLRASKALQSANIVEDFRASTSSVRRGSLESLLDATGVLNGVHNSNSEIREIVQRKEPEPPTKRRRSDRSAESPASSANGHKRGKSDNPFRRSLLSDPSYLQGGSRIHLISKYDAKEETRRQVSGVQTDYFRLKARGIATLPSGMPLANSAARDILRQKRSFDGITKPGMPKSLMPPPAPRSVPAKQWSRPEALRSSPELRQEIQGLKARAKARVEEDQEPRPRKRSFDDEDELFARAKRVREQMEEGTEWYRKEIEASRSVS